MKYIEDGLEVDLVKLPDGSYLEFEWRPVVGYEGYYLVSNYGQVKTVGRLVNSRGNKPRKMKDKIKSQHPHTNGYLVVQLSKDGINTTRTVHSLVYEAFIGKVEEGYTIDHINRINTDNIVTNLRPLTRSHNSMNRGPTRGSASKYKGVHKHTGHWKWRVCSHEPGGKTVHIGFFELEGDAALAYNDYIVKARGYELSVLNDLSNHDWELDRKESLIRKENHKKSRVRAKTRDQEN